MKQKISVIFILVMVIVFMGINSVNATLTCSVNMKTAKTEQSKKDQFTVDVNIVNVDTENGIVAFSGTLKYDTDSLKLVKMTGQDGWSNPSYNEANGKFVMDNNEPLTRGATILKITFEVLETSKKNVTISIDDVNIANGYDNPVVINDTVSQKITVKDSKNDNDNEDNNSDNDNKNDNNNTNNNENKIESNNTNTNKKPSNNANSDNGNNHIITTPGINNGSSDNKSENKTDNNNNKNTNSSLPLPSNTKSQTPPDKSTSNLPRTGNTNVAILGAIVILAGIAIMSFIKMRKIDNKRK